MKIKRWAWFIGLLGLGLAVFLAGPLPLVADRQPAPTPQIRPTELRGIWLTNIDSDVLFERQRLTGALQRLVGLHFNTVYPTVWNWGYTLYPSPTAGRIIGRSLDPTAGLQNRDVLAEIVEQGHRQGLKVVPWFEFGLMAPADSELVRRHPDWITQRRNGTQIVKEGSHNRVWLNPFHPQVQQFMMDLMAEIVTTYAVDGIQVDDHFGLPVELGYDAFTVNLYQQDHRGQPPPDNPRDPEWVSWRAERITGLIAQVFQTVKARRPDCQVTVAPNPQSQSYSDYLLDWRAWVQRGLVEAVVLQVYRDSLKNFEAELKRPEVQMARRYIPVSVGILIGLKHHSVPIELIQQQVRAARARGFAGVSFFYYETLGDRDAAFQKMLPAIAGQPHPAQGSQN